MMAYLEVIWDDEPDGNAEHIAEHDLTPEDVEEVLFNPGITTQVVRPACQSYSDSRLMGDTF